jgi:hypothetical protein
MKSIKWINIILLLMILFFVSCKTDEIALKALDAIPETKYYSSDIIPEQQSNIYGVWKVVRTSGGLAGSGYTKDFDYLILKKNGIFGIVRNDSLLTSGKLTPLPEVAMYLPNGILCQFDSEKAVSLELCADPVKYIRLVNKDSLDLIAPCCDRYNTHLIRKK